MQGRRGLASVATAVSFVGAVSVLPAPPAWAAAGTITTVAGGPGSGPAVSLGQDPRAIFAIGSRVWVLDARPGAVNYFLRTIDTTTGLESAPLATITGSSESTAPTAPSLTVDTAGNAFIAYNSLSGGLVEEVPASGQPRIIAGGGNLGHRDHVPATAEALGALNGVAVDSAGNVYVSENNWSTQQFGPTVATDSRIRKIGPAGFITTVAGTGAVGNSGDGGKGTNAKLNGPMGLATNPVNDTLFIADTGNHRVRRLMTNGIISNVVSGVSTQAIAYDSQGLVVEAEPSCAIQRLAAGRLVTVAGGRCGWDGDGGSALSAGIFPRGVAASGGLITFIQDVNVGGYHPGITAYVLRRVDGSGTVTQFAGTGRSTYGGDGGPATQAQFDSGPGVAIDSTGDLYLSDGSNDRVRRIDPAGTITTFAGTGGIPLGGDNGDGGPASQATFTSPGALSVGPDDSVYIVDAFGSRIRRVDAMGTVTTVAGGGTGGDGPATQARLYDTTAPAFEPSGDLLLGDYCELRRIDAQGVLTTVGGNNNGIASGKCGDAGDGGPASAAQFGRILDVVDDGGGNTFVATWDNSGVSPVYRVRRIDAGGIITTVAGGGTATTDGVPATVASIQADAIDVDAAGRLLIVEYTNGRVRRVNSDGTITTVAGGGTGGDGGPATSAQLLSPTDVVADPAGNLFIGCTDASAAPDNGAVRKVSAS